MRDDRTYTITLLPQQLHTTASFGDNLHTVIHAILVEVGSEQLSGYQSPCGGRGTCGKCKVQIISGMTSPLSSQEESLLSEEEISSGIRLACYQSIEDDLIIREFAEHREMSVETSFNSEEEMTVDRRFVESVLITCELPTLENNQDIAARVIAAVKEKHSLTDHELSLNVLHQLAVMNRHLTEIKESVEIWVHICNGRISGISPAEGLENFFGIAVDVGTTTIACYLIDLANGNIIGTESALNAQHIAGADVIARIGYTMSEGDGSQILSDSVKEQIQDLILNLCGSYQVSPEQITSAAIAGNTTMMHLLLGVDARTISRYPFNPVFTNSLICRDLFGELLNCSVYLLPSASGYIGADIVGGVVAIGMEKSPKTSLFVDIGTNGEIVLKTDSAVYTCSTAAGPAFEGASLSCGSGGVTGVIDSVTYHDESFRFTTIGDMEPMAICGSGVLDAVALLINEGLIDKKGKFTGTDHQLSDRIIEVKGQRALAFVGEKVYLNQADIREIQLAKSAICTGIESLSSAAGIALEDIEVLYIGGGFGSKIRISSAAVTGLIPAVLSDRVICVGNSSGRGAAGALLDKSFRERCEALRTNMQVIDLSGRKSFTKDLMRNMYFNA